MVSFKELKARWKEFLRFSRQELSGLLFAILITGFIFSFRDWGGGETADFGVGLTHLAAVLIIAALSFFFRIACQKMYALSQGYLAEFKVWWAGLAIMLVVGLITAGRIPLVLIGGIVAAFMTKQRLGEFRYGFSHYQNAIISMWGIYGNLILTLVFAVGLHFAPLDTLLGYFFHKGLILNLIMSFCALFPLPQLDGLQIYFGSRGMYFFGIFLVLLASILLLTKTTFGLITAIVTGALIAIVYILIGSEK